ncbi:hypothetical protein BUALT_Bualt01G0181100 [Buddleja alternifolia]|uniref:Uncharacterized protein n=1 Tax=Buddleja alternifolia TaxID=168488 RepID=A0AAV6Y941_9LAMI|nr:hypothetical protein BUALT_Bualt01G0181100 [Buddleja alternifolia]
MDGCKTLLSLYGFVSSPNSVNTNSKPSISAISPTQLLSLTLADQSPRRRSSHNSTTVITTKNQSRRFFYLPSSRARSPHPRHPAAALVRDSHNHHRFYRFTSAVSHHRAAFVFGAVVFLPQLHLRATPPSFFSVQYSSKMVLVLDSGDSSEVRALIQMKSLLDCILPKAKDIKLVIPVMETVITCSWSSFEVLLVLFQIRRAKKTLKAVTSPKLNLKSAIFVFDSGGSLA